MCFLVFLVLCVSKKKFFKKKREKKEEFHTTETLNKAQREEVREKKSWKLKSCTQTRAHKTPSLSLSLTLLLLLKCTTD